MIEDQHNSEINLSEFNACGVHGVLKKWRMCVVWLYHLFCLYIVSAVKEGLGQ